MFPTVVYSFHPIMERIVFLHNTKRVQIIRRKEICRIRRGGKITKNNSEATYMASGADLGYSGIFIWEGSIINGNRR